MSDEEGLSLKVLDWEEAAGFLGQLALVARLVISFLGLVIFAVAIVVINNAMMMATLQRVREIGTLRAIGGQKGLVVSMILVETVVLVFAFGLAGTALGAAIMAVLGTKGIPATREELYFFFSGPKLLPTLSAGNILLAFAVVFVVSVLSALYPALLATRVPPATAMGTAEE
jgi:ABC-type antimicrobial peptide transport system permease subunit